MIPREQIMTYNTVIPFAAFTNATVNASSTHPVTSLPTPAERATTPIDVCKSLSSVRILARTGNAVMEKLTPMKSMKIPNEGADGPPANVL